jgi:putative ABC transport system permease protein
MPDASDPDSIDSKAAWARQVRSRLGGLGLAPAREAEIVEELSLDLADRYADLRAAGETEADARRLVLEELGPAEAGHDGQQTGDVLARQMGALRQSRVSQPRAPMTPGRAGAWLGIAEWPAEIARALRVHRRNLPTAAAVIATLALGIGAATSIFSVVHALFLQPLPYGTADRLVMIWEDASARGGPSQDSVAAATFLDWRQESTAFSELAAVRNITRTFTDMPVAYSPLVHAVTSNYFRVVGTEPLLGRTFAPGEDTAAARVTMLSYGMWQTLFGGDPAAVGRTVALDDVPHEIIGIVPPAYYSANYFATQPGAWIPLPIETFREERGIRRFLVFGTLKDDLTVEQAQADMSGVSRRLAGRFPLTNDKWGASVVPIREQLVGRVERPMRLVVAGAAMLMLIAGFNVVCLLLAAGTARVKDMAARRALGAPAYAIVRQLLVEAAILAVAGAGLGLLLSAPANRYVISLLPQQNLVPVPFLEAVGTNLPVAAFAAGCGLVIAMLCALATARQALRADVVAETSRNTARSSTEGRFERLVRQGLVVAQVALSVMLLLGAGLMGRSVLNLTTFEPGFDPSNLLTVGASIRGPSYAEPGAANRFFAEVSRRIEALPGVVSAAAVSRVPPVSMFDSTVFSVDDREASQGTAAAARVIVHPGYFETMRIPLVAGRAPTELDTPQSEPVAVVSRELASRYFGGENPVGRTIVVGDGNRKTRRLVIGVAGDVRSAGVNPRPRPVIYTPHSQSVLLDMAWVVRMEEGRTIPAADLRQIVHSIDSRAPVYDAQAMTRVVRDTDSLPRFVAALLGVFTFVGLALVATGMYGVLGFVVAVRQREIGLRLALGARFPHIAGIVTGFALRVVGLGCVAGMLGFLGLGAILESLLFGVTRNDTGTYVSVLAVVAAITLAVCVPPLRRARRVDPLIVMRS